MYFGLLSVVFLAGIDVDGRREMIKHMIPCLEKSIKRFIAFAKALPGFKDIPIEDQIALIKGELHIHMYPQSPHPRMPCTNISPVPSPTSLPEILSVKFNYSTVVQNHHE